MHHLPSRYIPCDGRLTASAYFKSTLPAWGATRLVSQQHCCCAFQSTLPAGERQSSSLLCVVLHYISTHTPRMGSDRQRRASDNKRRISIHAPRMGSDSTVKAYSNDRIKRSTLREPHFLFSKNACFSPIFSMCATTSRTKNQRIRVSFGSYPGLAPTCFTLAWYRFPRL